MEEGEPEVKRKKCYTKREALQKLEELSGNVAEVVGVYKLVNSCSHLLPQVQLLLTSAPLMQQTKIWRSTMTSWLLCSPPWKKRSTDWKLMLKTGNFDTNLAVLKRISSLVVQNTTGVNKKSKKFNTVWHGIWAISKLAERVNQASLTVCLFLKCCLLDFLNFISVQIAWFDWKCKRLRHFCPHFVHYRTLYQ